jgi:hypothetical protein
MDDTDGSKGQVDHTDGSKGVGHMRGAGARGKRGGHGAFCWSGPDMVVAPYSGWLPAKKMCGHSSMMNGSSSLRGKHAKVSAPLPSPTYNGQQLEATFCCHVLWRSS